MKLLTSLFQAFGLWLALCGPGLADCLGRDLIAALPAQTRAALQAQSAVPFAEGNVFAARKGDAQILLVGTYHLADPRFDAAIEGLTPALSAARELLVELSPADESALKSWLASHPEAVFDQAGPSLRDRLSPADWSALSAAVQARGTPPAAILKMRPWLVAAMLEAPACVAMDKAALARGLDHRLTALAEAQGLPITSLEPFDTALKVFATLSPDDQLDMIRQALLTEPVAEDMATTLTEAYFRGQSQLYMAFARAEAIRTSGRTAAEVDRELNLMLGQLVDARNANWIPVLEKAATQGPVVAAFGALHLPGDKGVAQLLTADGWTVTPWTPGQKWPR